MVNGIFSIFRLSTAGQTESTVSDKVEFSGDAILPDARSFITNIRAMMELPKQDNQTPGSNDPNLLDETGLVFTGLEINGYFIGNESASPISIRLIRNWLKADKRITNFTFGRFGFRNSVNNEFDLTPSATAGYILDHFDVIYNYPNRDYLFRITLRFNGDITQLNST